MLCNSNKHSIFAASKQLIAMLERKITPHLQSFLENNPYKIMLLNGARQIGKSFIIRHVGRQMFSNFVEIDLRADKEGAKVFADVRTTDDFYLQLSIIAGGRLGDRSDTLVFLDEIQSYPHLLTMLKFLNQEARYRYIASGSQLGIALAKSTSVPLGSVEIQRMYPLDFEEFLWAMGVGKEALGNVQNSFSERLSLNESTHNYILKLFRYYLMVGGLPDAVNAFVLNRNIVDVRKIQADVHELYGIDASQYDEENRLKIRKIYNLIPSVLENKKKRIVVKNIEHKAGKQFSDYQDEFEYLIESSIALDVNAVSNPRFPIIESQTKNLLKLYLNDVGILTELLYSYNANAILQDERSVNLGTVYESVVAQELRAHGYERLFYYDNKQHGEVDFLIDNYDTLSVIPIEVKSGKDYYVHSALSHFVNTKDYHVKEAIAFSNEREVRRNGKIIYMPVYYVMFLQKSTAADLILPMPTI